jgi:hypothetical protein
MKFANIVEFENLKRNCEFCGSPLFTEFNPKKVPNIKPQYTMMFDTTLFAGVPGISEVSPENQISYSSQDYQDIVSFYYDFQGRSNLIFSVEKQSNRIIGDLDKVQKVLWDNKLHLVRLCKSTTCAENGNQYYLESSMLVLERIDKRLYSFRPEIEMLAIRPKENSFALISPYNHKNKTFLVAVEKSKIISQLPFMYLHRIKGGEVITNKIKTLITFS